MAIGRNSLRVVILAALLALPVPLFAVTFYVTGDADNAYVIEGNDIEARSTVEISVVYDSNALSNPRASVDQGTVTEVNDLGGAALVKAVQGDDSTATFHLRVQFDKREGLEGRIFSVAGKVIGPDGALAETRTLPAVATPDVLQNWSADEMPQESSGSSGGYHDILTSEQNILKRFAEFTGKRSLEAFVALFGARSPEMPVQEPPIALSDGKTVLKLHLPPLGDLEGDAPDLVFSDARLLSVEREEAGGWMVNSLPNPGAYEVSLIVRAGDRVVQYPLVVAAPIKLKHGLNENNFLSELDRFLLEKGPTFPGEKKSKDAVLSYLFTANFLALPGRGSPLATADAGARSQH